MNKTTPRILRTRRDTTCAIVGGIVAMRSGIAGIPDAWRQAREPLPDWPFE